VFTAGDTYETDTGLPEPIAVESVSTTVVDALTTAVLTEIGTESFNTVKAEAGAVVAFSASE
jgi:hypothetical protein